MPPQVAIPVIACVAALLLTPMTSRLAHTKGWVDNPGLRKVHSAPVAYLGGVAVVGAVIIALLVGHFALHIEAPVSPGLIAIALGTLAMFATGLLDDIKDLRATTKLAVQIGAAAVVVGSGVSIDSIALWGDLRLEFGVFSILVTMFWIVGVTNALNFIDGLDGLCSGISIVASAAIAWTAFQLGHPAVALLLLALAGALAGFLPHNTHPARVFLGDAGSLTLGFILASTAAYTASGKAPLMGFAIPLIALGIPILDTLFSMTRRVIERRSMMSPDRNHLHHRLISRGFTHPRTVITICAVSIAAILTAMAATLLSPAGQLAALVSLLFAYSAFFRSVGAIRFTESMSAIGRVASDSRVANAEKQLADNAQLVLDSARDVEQWWGGIVSLARELEYVEITLQLEASHGGPDFHDCVNLRPARLAVAGREVPALSTFQLALNGGADGAHLGSLRLTQPATVSLEVQGRRIALICRLLSSSALPQQASIYAARPSRGVAKTLRVSPSLGGHAARLPVPETKV